MSAEIMNYFSENFMRIVLVAGTFILMICDTHADRKLKHNMGATLLLVLLLSVQNYADMHMESADVLNPWRIHVSFLGYVIRPVLLLLLVRILVSDKFRLLLWVIPGINLAVHTTMYYSHLSVWFDAANGFHRGPLGYCSHILSILLLLILVIDLIISFRDIPWKEVLTPALCVVLVVFGSVMDTFFSSGYLNRTIAVCCPLYYAFLHMQYVHLHEQQVEEEHRAQLMLSQMQPHFMYNTLSTIRALCRIDPGQAEKTINQFSSYLRYNFSALSDSKLIDFRQELEHTRTYAEIEMLRFPNIHMEYDISDYDFRLPPITLQPLVENAIKYGVRARETGTVLIRTLRRGDDHILIVQDNGIGFDAAAIDTNGSANLSLQNITSRLKRMETSTLTVESTPDLGTTVTIVIPARCQPSPAIGS